MSSGDQLILNQLCKMTDELKDIKDLSKKSENRVIDVYFITIPEEGGTRTFYIGLTKINFKTGIITNPDGSIEQLKRFLDAYIPKNDMHSLSLYPNQDMKFKLNASGYHTVTEGINFQLPYVTYREMDIICTRDTEINLFACTNPQATIGTFRMTAISGITQTSVEGESTEAGTNDAVTDTLLNNLNRIRYNIAKVVGETYGTVTKDLKTAIADLVTHAADTSTHGVAQIANHAEIGSQVGTHAALTASHGVSEVADAANYENGADVTDAVNIASSIVGVVGKTTPVDADTVPIIDSAVSNSLKELTWANIKATLKTYMDTLYDVAGGLTTHAALTASHGVAQIANHAEIGTQIGTHASDTSTHGVSKVADDADFETGADVTDSINVGQAILDVESKATIALSDRFAILDSEDSYVLGEVSFTKMRANHKAYFDGIYDVLGGLATHAALTASHGVAQIANHAEIASQVGTHAALTASHGVAQIANHAEIASQVGTHASDTSTHGVSKVADDADFETGADVTDVANVGQAILDVETKATVAQADRFAILDSEDSYVLGEVAFSKMQANHKAYFDGLYDVLGGLSTHAALTASHGVGTIADADDLRIADITDMNGQSFTNLIYNYAFDIWSNGDSAAPDGWTDVSLVAIEKEDTIVKINNYSLKCTPDATSDRANYAISNFDDYKGKTITVGAWVYAANSGKAKIGLSDGIVGTSSDAHTGGSTWQFITLTQTIAANPTYLYIRFWPDVDTGDQVGYIDGVILVEGSVCPAPSPKPLDINHEVDTSTHGVSEVADAVYSVPSGGIIIWSGAIVNIPTGWVICDGDNSTPNLQDKFIVGAGSTYAVAATGGEVNHALSVAELAAHTHSINSGSGAATGAQIDATVGDSPFSTGSTGSGTAHNNLPPYYALAYIMKT